MVKANKTIRHPQLCTRGFVTAEMYYQSKAELNRSLKRKGKTSETILYPMNSFLESLSRFTLIYQDHSWFTQVPWVHVTLVRQN